MDERHDAGRQRRRPRPTAPSHWVTPGRQQLQASQLATIVEAQRFAFRELTQQVDWSNGCPVCYYMRPVRESSKLREVVQQQYRVSTDWESDFFPGQQYQNPSPYRQAMMSTIRANMSDTDTFVRLELSVSSQGAILPQNYRVTRNLTSHLCFGNTCIIISLTFIVVYNL